MADGMENDFYTSLQQEVDSTLEKRNQELKEKERQHKKDMFSQKQQNLINKILEYEDKYGPEDQTVTLMKTFLAVSFEMQKTMDALEAINSAMSCITDAISFMDIAIDLDQNMMDESLTHKYGFFARMRQKRLMRKTVRNNVGRMKAIYDGMVMKYNMAHTMMSAMSDATASMTKRFNRSKKKTKTSAQTNATFAEVDRVLSARRAEMGMDKDPTTDDSATTDSGLATPPPTGNSSTDIDDIL